MGFYVIWFCKSCTKFLPEFEGEWCHTLVHLLVSCQRTHPCGVNGILQDYMQIIWKSSKHYQHITMYHFVCGIFLQPKYESNYWFVEYFS